MNLIYWFFKLIFTGICILLTFLVTCILLTLLIFLVKFYFKGIDFFDTFRDRDHDVLWGVNYNSRNRPTQWNKFRRRQNTQFLNAKPSIFINQLQSKQVNTG